MRYFDRNRKRLTKKQFVRGTLTSSNGENEAVIEDSAGLPFESIEISGKTRQATFKGYNLLNKEYFNQEGLRNETVVQLRVDTVLNTEMVNSIFKPNTTYTISFEVEGVSDIPSGTTAIDYAGFVLFSTKSTIFWFDVQKFVKKGEILTYSKTFTTPENFTESSYYMRSYSSAGNVNGVFTVFTCIIRNVQIVEGSTQKPYEPYVGGIPSPNPDYPQAIENANNGVNYQVVEYLESNGTQYIDTGVRPTINTTVEVTCVNKSHDRFVYGSRTSVSSSDKHCVNFNPDASIMYPLFGNSSTASSSFATDTTTVYTVRNGKDGCYMNGTKIRNYGDVKFETSTFPMYLFALNTPAETYTKRAFVGQIYGCKIYEGTELIRDFVPCYRTADGVMGMFDTVNNVFYTNDGTGEFIKGADVATGTGEFIKGADVATGTVNVTLHGDNLFNQEYLLTDSNFTKAEYNGEECIKVVPTRYPNFTIPISIPSGTEISLSFEMIHPETAGNFSIYLKYEDNTTYHIVYYTKQSILNDYTKIAKTKILDKNVTGLYFAFYDRGNCRTYYFKDFMVNVGESKPYEPYFREEIAIPASVEVEGATVELNMASISITDTSGTYTATDYLTVDKPSNKVLYRQNVGKKTLTSAMVWQRYTYNGKVYFGCREVLGARWSKVPILANKYPGIVGVGGILAKDYGITADCLWYGGNYRNVITVRDIRFDNLDDLKADLDLHPLEIEYGLAEEITHDITRTDFGQALLNLTLPRTQSGIFTVESPIGVGGVSVEYYSIEKEDKVTLEVLCMTGEGEELKRTSKSVRCGTKYLAAAPEIDGYTPIIESIFGVALADAQIIFEYKEVEDATV